MHTRDTTIRIRGVLRCAKTYYHTHTRTTCFGNTMGFSVPVLNPIHYTLRHNTLCDPSIMESWATASPSIRSFTSLFSASQYPPPKDCTKTMSTKRPSAAEVEISGHSFHYLERMQPSHLQISEEHTLKWASTLLDTYGLSPS